MAHILIIEDDASVRQMVRDMLDQEGHEVTEVADGEKGLAYYKEHLPDLVITDLFMPKVDGVEVIRELQADFPQAKIIAMTARAEKEDYDFLRVTEALGARYTLKKPFSAGDLREAVETVLKAD